MAKARLFKNHRRAFNDAKSQLAQSPLSNLVICTVLAMTILLATTLFISLQTFKYVTQGLQANSKVSVYLKPASKDQDIKDWVAQLKQNDALADITYISADQALHEIMQQSDLKDMTLPSAQNPLPATLMLKFSHDDKQQIYDFIETIQQNTLVESIHFDHQWFEQLFTLLSLGNRLTYVLAFILGVGMLFIVGHIIHGAILKNHREIIVLQQIGAPPSYIRRPFLYLGGMLGMGGGLLAIFFLWLILLSLQQPLHILLQSHAPRINLTFTLWILLPSSFLGWLSAYITFYLVALMQRSEIKETRIGI